MISRSTHSISTGASWILGACLSFMITMLLNQAAGAEPKPDQMLLAMSLFAGPEQKPAPPMGQPIGKLPPAPVKPAPGSKASPGNGIPSAQTPAPGTPGTAKPGMGTGTATAPPVVAKPVPPAPTPAPPPTALPPPAVPAKPATPPPAVATPPAATPAPTPAPAAPAKSVPQPPVVAMVPGTSGAPATPPSSTTAAVPPTPAGETAPVAPGTGSGGVLQLPPALPDTVSDGYTYDPKSRRDPFQSMVQLIKIAKAQSELPPLQRVELNDLKLMGIIWGGYGYFGLIQTPDGKGYTVKEGTLVGPNHGVVKSISQNRMVVSEPTIDINGKKSKRDIDIPLRAKEGMK